MKTKTKAQRDHDAAPNVGAVGAGAEEVRECGPLDASDVEDRMAKQRPPVSLNRQRPGVED